MPYIYQNTLQRLINQTRQLSLSSLILVPLKQHFGCCILLPTLLKTAGSISILGTFLLYPQFHLLLALGMAPFVVWLCLKLEDLYHAKQHDKGHFAGGHAHHHHHHETDCGSCEPCPVDHTKHGFWRRYWVNLAIALILVLILDHFHDHHRNS